MRILCLNAGSSTLKYALFEIDAHREKAIETQTSITASGDDVAAIARSVVERAAKRDLDGVAHRIVFGGPEHDAPQLLTKALRARLEELRTYDELHFDPELRAIDAVTRAVASVPQVVSFDTAFHRRMPSVAKRLPISSNGDPAVQRYGFHGLSYEYVLSVLGSRALGRVIVAHWGSGASIAALRDGMPIDCSMGFTPLGGMMMGTRPGDLDPGVLLYLLRRCNGDVQELNRVLYRECGLAGVSGTRGDMRALVEASASDTAAAAAVGLFVHLARKQIAALTASLGGIDRLVFTGGIGENSAAIRALVVLGLRYLGIELDPRANAAAAACISTASSRVTVNIIPTDENRTLARHAHALLAGSRASGR